MMTASGGAWTCASVESMSPVKDFLKEQSNAGATAAATAGRGSLDPVLTAVRGLEEEVGLVVQPHEVQMVVSYLKVKEHEFGAGGFVDFRRRKSASGDPALTAMSVQTRWVFAADKFESVELAFVQFTPVSMARFMMSNRLSTATGAVCIAILRQFFSMEELENAFTLGNKKLPIDESKVRKFELQKTTAKSTAGSGGNGSGGSAGALTGHNSKSPN